MNVLLQVIYTVKAFDYKKCVWPFQKKKVKGVSRFFFFSCPSNVCPLKNTTLQIAPRRGDPQWDDPCPKSGFYRGVEEG